MPKVSGRKRLKHVKTHGLGKKTKEPAGPSDNFNEVAVVNNAQELSNDISLPSPSPAPCCSSVESSSRPPSSLSVAESESLDFLDDNSCISSPDPSVISPVLSVCTDPLNVSYLSNSGSSFQLQTTASPTSTSDESTSDSVSQPSTPFKVPSREMGESYSPVQFHKNSSPQRRSSNSEALLKMAQGKLEIFLKTHQITMVHEDALHIMYVSRNEDKVTQRLPIAKPDGTLKFKVHCKTLPLNNFVKDIPRAKHLNVSTVPYFVDRLVHVLNVISSFEVCVGVSNVEYKDVWSECKSGVVDINPYRESRYQETFRSSHCDKLVPLRKRRCEECGHLVEVLKRKSEMAAKEEIHPNTTNISLSESQRLKKLGKQKKKIDVINRKNKRLQEKIEQLLQEEGVEVDEDIANDFKAVLDHQNLTEAQSMFLQQQMKAIKAKGPRGRRWHPAMIRFALSVFMKSHAAYGAIYDSGLLILPSRRTLFDYIHFKPVHDGIDYEVVESVSKNVESMVQSGNDYKKFHVLMCDEMYISKNLVYKKSTGKVVGFCSDDDVSSELAALQAYLEDPSANSVPKKVIASKVLAFLIKGVASDVKEVVATYFVDSLTKEELYRWTWEIITKLERAGIAVIAFTSDGSSINRSFIKMNKPATEGAEVIFDTVNKAVPQRKIYFIADVPHLLKTIRNSCLTSSNRRYFSRTTGKMMLRRRLEKNSQRIMWSTIVKLYQHQSKKTLRLCPKLNVQSVFLNGYSKMKVKYAAHILSRSVAQMLKGLQSTKDFENTTETVNFIRKANDFFDMLNGAHSLQGQRTRNDNLKPYRTISDPRFQELQNFLNFLKEWKEDAEKQGADITVDLSTQEADPGQQDVDDPVDPNDEELVQDPASVRQLPKQTVEGIFITVLGFTGAVKYLLSAGARYINPRVFCQDPLEQYFSKQRSRCGGSTNPNQNQVGINARLIHLSREMTSASRSGNTEVEKTAKAISDDPLPKRRKTKVSSVHITPKQI